MAAPLPLAVPLGAECSLRQTERIQPVLSLCCQSPSQQSPDVPEVTQSHIWGHQSQPVMCSVTPDFGEMALTKIGTKSPISAKSPQLRAVAMLFPSLVWMFGVGRKGESWGMLLPLSLCWDLLLSSPLVVCSRERFPPCCKYPKLMERTRVTARAQLGVMVWGRNSPGSAPAAFLSSLVSKERGLLAFPGA